MDSLIISGIRIYFPKPGERLPVPPDNMRNFAVKGTVGERCCLWHICAKIGMFSRFLNMNILERPLWKQSGRESKTGDRVRVRKGPKAPFFYSPFSFLISALSSAIWSIIARIASW